MKTNEESIEKILFKTYYDFLDKDSKNAIRDKMNSYGISYSTFYNKIKKNSFKELEFLVLEEITGKTLIR